MTSLSETALVDIATAARMLESGRLVAFPTETVYGLGADAENPDAVQKIFALKGRPSDRPLSINISVDSDYSYWASSVPENAWKLIASFWPGPLTLVLEKSRHVPETVSRGKDSVALRCPAHPMAIALLKAFRNGRGGIAAPSANKSGHISPTTAQHVRDEFGRDTRLGMILDGGACDFGIESTILDLAGDGKPRILRPGAVSAEQIAEVIGMYPAVDVAHAHSDEDRHYAPQKPAVMLSKEEIRQKVEAGIDQRVVLLVHSADLETGFIRDISTVEMVAMPDNPEGYSQKLYAVLHEMDGRDIDVILIESVPSSEEWRAVRNRLSGVTEAGQKSWLTSLGSV